MEIKKIFAIPLIASCILMSTCKNTWTPKVEDAKNINKVLKGKDNLTALLTIEPIPRKGGFGDVVSLNGTIVYLELPNQNKEQFLKTSYLIYNVETGDLNNDGTDDFILSSYKTIKNGFGEIVKNGETASEIYLSSKGNFKYTKKK
jgi:hypothetical protein